MAEHDTAIAAAADKAEYNVYFFMLKVIKKIDLKIIRRDKSFSSRLCFPAADRRAVFSIIHAAEPQANTEFDIQVFRQHQRISEVEADSDGIAFSRPWRE